MRRNRNLTAPHLLMLGVLGGGGAWSPLALGSSLVTWMDPSDLSTLYQGVGGTNPVTADGQSVPYAADKSGNGRHFSRSTIPEAPIVKFAELGGRAILRFGANTNYNLISTFGITLTQPNCIWIIAKRPAVNTSYYFDGIDGTNRQLLYESAPRIYAGADVIATGVTVTNWNLFTCIYNGASSILRANGVQVASGNAGAAGLAGLTINTARTGGGYSGSDFAEIVVMSGLPSAAIITQMESYMNSKWTVYSP